MSEFQDKDTDLVEADFLPGEVVHLRCTVQQCKPSGEKNLSLEVEDGSGLTFALNSESPAICVGDKHPSSESGEDDEHGIKTGSA